MHARPVWIIPKHQIGAAGEDEEGRIAVTSVTREVDCEETKDVSARDGCDSFARW